MWRGDATTSRARGLREAKQEATARCEVRPCNSNERQSGQQMRGGGVRRGDGTTSRTRGAGGNDAMRGDGMMRGVYIGRWEAAV
jgi:hypothetical protein